MRGDNSPVKQTCPIIDRIISSVHDIYQSSDHFSRKEYDDFEKAMEEIRKMNADLREWGNEQYNLANEFEKDLDREKGRTEELEQQVESLKEEIKMLENEAQQASNS